MKTTLAGRFLAMTIMAGLLMASFAIAQKSDQPEVLMQAVHQRQQVEGALPTYAEASLDTDQCNVPPEFPFGYAKTSLDLGRSADRTRLAVRAQPAGLSDGYAMTALISVADSSDRLLTTFQAADLQKVSQLTVLAGMPERIWCMLHFFCKRGW